MKRSLDQILAEVNSNKSDKALLKELYDEIINGGFTASQIETAMDVFDEIGFYPEQETKLYTTVMSVKQFAVNGVIQSLSSSRHLYDEKWVKKIDKRIDYLIEKLWASIPKQGSEKQ